MKKIKYFYLRKSTTVKSRLLLLIFLFIHFSSSSQSYFQQQVNHTINVLLDNKEKTLTGFETIIYKNNSPDTLFFLYFHLWPNAYRNKHTPFARQQLAMSRSNFALSSYKEKGYIDSLNFKVNGQNIHWKYTDKSYEIAKLFLNEPLLPGKQIVISTPFFVKLPFLFSRMGYDKQGNIAVTQWYPKPAVYDNYGWHVFHYLDLGEFYSEFGNYDVTITVPDSLIVAATGNLKTEQEIKWLNNKIKHKNLFEKKPVSTKMKTLRFTQNNVHDFAWFTNANYIVERDTVSIFNGHHVETWLFYLPKNKKLYKNMLAKINQSVQLFSKWNGAYPYKTVKVVDGGLLAGGGMEYPTITVIASMDNAINLEETIIHEIGHNWFYGILGFNERDYPFLDEGITTSNQLRYMQTVYPKHYFGQNYLPDKLIKGKLSKYPQRFNMLIPYLVSACSFSDCPTNTHSEKMTPINYETIVYMKTAYLFYYLRYYLGDSVYDKAMNTFYNKWKFKHPYPENLSECFKSVTGKSLTWFFDQSINSSKKANYKISTANNNIITIKNKGKINAPFEIGYYKHGKLILKQWITGFSKKQKLHIADSLKDYDYVVLNPEQYLYELPNTNNYSKRKGWFKKVEPLKISLFADIETPVKRHLYYFPIIAGNRHNNLMTGMLFYNAAVFKKRITFYCIPMLSLSKNPFSGMGSVNYNFFQPQTTSLRLIRLKLSAQQFALWNNDRMSYQRYNGQILFLFDNKHFNSTHQLLKIDNLYVSNWISMLYYNKNTYQYYNRVNFTQYSSNKISPYNISATLLTGNNFSRAEIKGDYKYVYDGQQHFIGFRFFAGKFLYNTTTDPTLNFRLSGIDGTNDITYDYLYLARNYFHSYSDFISQQFTDDQGRFSYYSPFQDNSWMASVQFRTTFPAPKFLHIYTCIASFRQSTNIFNSPLVYEAGIEAELIPNILKIYFPITASNKLISVNNLYTNNYFQKIRFVFNITEINPLKIYDKFLYHFAF